MNIAIAAVFHEGIPEMAAHPMAYGRARACEPTVD